MINEGDKHLDDYMILEYCKDDIIQFASEIFHVFIDDWNKLREKLINWNDEVTGIVSMVAKKEVINEKLSNG